MREVREVRYIRPVQRPQASELLGRCCTRLLLAMYECSNTARRFTRNSPHTGPGSSRFGNAAWFCAGFSVGQLARLAHGHVASVQALNLENGA